MNVANAINPSEAARLAYDVIPLAMLLPYGMPGSDERDYFQRLGDAVGDLNNEWIRTRDPRAYIDDWTMWHNVQAAVYMAGYIHGARDQKEKQRARRGRK